MRAHDRAYQWWKRKPGHLRKPAVFALGVLFIIIAPFIGWIPGPGGIVIFLAGIAILGSEFDWAKSLHAFFLTTVPAEVKKRWQPTPKWQTTFDIVAALMLLGFIFALTQQWWASSASLGTGSLCLFMFNRRRLENLKQFIRKKR